MWFDGQEPLLAHLQTFDHSLDGVSLDALAVAERAGAASETGAEDWWGWAEAGELGDVGTEAGAAESPPLTDGPSVGDTEGSVPEPSAPDAEDGFFALPSEEPSVTTDIVVIGRRPPPSDPSKMGGEPPPTIAGPEPGTETYTAPSPEHQCTCGNMTEAEKREQNIDAEVAEVLAEILAKANQAMEYGSLIYIDRSGMVQHTPLINSTTYTAAMNLSALPTNADGTPDYSTVVGIVHSHPQYLPHPETGVITEYYRPSDPDHLLYPSRSEEWGGTQGDWLSFDNIAAQISADFGNSSNLAFYIIGYSAGGLQINKYGWEDRETDTVASGELVDNNTEACTC